MAGPICEISPEEVPISNYAVRYTERRLPNGNYEPTCPPAAIGTAWEAEAGSLEHIWSDDMPFAKYQFAAGKLASAEESSPQSLPFFLLKGSLTDQI